MAALRTIKKMSAPRETYQLKIRTLRMEDTPPPGSFIFCNGHTFLSRVIEFGEWLDASGKENRICYFPSHVRIVIDTRVNADGSKQWRVVEAIARGVVDHWVTPDTSYWGVVATDERAAQVAIIDKAIAIAASGVKYDWLAIVRIGIGALGHFPGFKHLTNWLLRSVVPQNDNPRRMTCSEVAARCIEYVAGPQPELEPVWPVTPAMDFAFLRKVAGKPA